MITKKGGENDKKGGIVAQFVGSTIGYITLFINYDQKWIVVWGPMENPWRRGPPKPVCIGAPRRLIHPCTANSLGAHNETHGKFILRTLSYLTVNSQDDSHL